MGNRGQALIEFIVVIPVALAFCAFFYEVSFLEFKKVMCFAHAFTHLRDYRNSSDPENPAETSSNVRKSRSNKLTAFSPVIEGDIIKVSAKCDDIRVDLSLPFLMHYEEK